MRRMVPESICSQARDIGQVARALCLHFLIHLDLPRLLTETINIEVIQGIRKDAWDGGKGCLWGLFITP